MGLPARLQSQPLVRIRPVDSIDSYGNVVQDYDAGTRTEFRGWIEQRQRDEAYPDGRNPLEQEWLLVTELADLTAADRVEWAGHPNGTVVYTVYGPPAPIHTPAGYHHTEADLRLQTG